MDVLVLKADNWIKFFVRKCLKDIQFAHGGQKDTCNQYAIACAIVSMARLKCKLDDIWPRELVELSGLEKGHLTDM